MEWNDQAAAEVPLVYLTDEQILALCDAQLDTDLQQELRTLLVDQREGTLSSPGRERLDRLMQFYGRELVRKAQTLKIAVDRGLRPSNGLPYRP